MAQKGCDTTLESTSLFDLCLRKHTGKARKSQSFPGSVWVLQRVEYVKFFLRKEVL